MTQMPDPLLLSIGADPDTSSADLAFGGRGDPLMVAGLAQYHQVAARLLALAPGALLGSPDAGAGLSDMLGQPLTEERAAGATARARATLAGLAATEEVIALTLSQPTYDTLILDAVVQLAGLGPVPLTWTLAS